MVNNMTDLTAQEAAAWQTRDHLDDPVIGELRNRFGPDALPFRSPVPGFLSFGLSVNSCWKLSIS